jgi:hypothetical protein
MSFQAMAWAIKQPLNRSCEKFLLVMLANYSDNEGILYPSVERLTQDLSQDRKTVVKNLKGLIELGLLADTGRRIGQTKSIIVYQLIGVPDASKFFYTYKLTRPDTGEYYVGARASLASPEFDSYYGSGQWPRDMKDKNVFLEKEILEHFETWEEAVASEARFFRSMDRDDGLCRNLQTLFVQRQRGLMLHMQHYGKTESSTVFPTASKASSTVFPTKESQKRIPEPISNPVTKESIVGFESFWLACPRRIGKEAARKAYEKARKMVSDSELLEGIRRYAATRAGQDEQYTVHPATWLNQGRWADEPAAGYAQGQGQKRELTEDEKWEAARRFDEFWKNKERMEAKNG